MHAVTEPIPSQRFLQVVIDLSKAASISDMRGSRIAVMSAVLQAFIREFFDQNPLSQLGIVRMRGGVAERLTELSGSPVSRHPPINLPAYLSQNLHMNMETQCALWTLYVSRNVSLSPHHWDYS